jgi:hypothetical protein
MTVRTKLKTGLLLGKTFAIHATLIGFIDRAQLWKIASLLR